MPTITKSPLGTALRNLSGPALGLAIAGWLLSRIELSGLVQSWRLISPWWWLASFGVGVLSQLFRALRWRYLLLPVDSIPMRKLVSALFVGQAATWLLPFRLGEAGGAYTLSRTHRVSFTAAMGSVVTDRLIDLAWLLGALAYALFFLSMGSVVLPEELFGRQIEVSRGFMIHATQVLVAVLASAALVLMVFRVWKARWVRCAHRLLDPLSGTLADRFEQLLDSFTTNLDALRRGHHLGMIVLSTAAYWGLGQLGIWLLIRSYPLGAPPSFSLSLLVIVAVAAGLALPNAPGYVGTFHLAIVMGLLLDSPQIALSQALGFAVYYHLSAFLPCILIGVYFMWRNGVSIAHLPTGRRRGKEG